MIDPSWQQRICRGMTIAFLSANFLPFPGWGRLAATGFSIGTLAYSVALTRRARRERTALQIEERQWLDLQVTKASLETEQAIAVWEVQPKPSQLQLPSNQAQVEEKDWIPNFLWKGGGLRSAHIVLQGSTNSGKSTLGEYLMRLIRDGGVQETLLINPKYLAASPTWSMPCNYPGIERAIEGLQAANRVLIERSIDESFNPKTASHCFVVVDE